MRATIEAILVVQTQLAALDPEGYEIPPRGPAVPGEIEAAERALGSPLPSEYRRFLEIHNGWLEVPWTMELFGTPELTDEDYTFHQQFMANEGMPAGLRNATIIGKDYNFPKYLFMLDSGNIVLYDRGELLEQGSNFDEFFDEVLVMVTEYYQHQVATVEPDRRNEAGKPGVG